MGFFDKMLKGLGFEGEQKQPKEKPEKKQTTVTHTGLGAKYDLSKTEDKKPEPKTYAPTNQVEVQEILGVLKQEKAIVVNLENLSKSDYMRALDFVSGAVYFVGGKIQKLSEKMFFLCIEN